MKPLFFGESSRQLFGAYEPPRPGSARKHAALLCYPGVQEYNMSHWAFRKLAVQLAREGLHVLRFDYYGTGDSAGTTQDGSPDRWIADIRTAARELVDLSGVRTLSIV